MRAAYTVRVWTFIDSIAYHMNARHVRTYPDVMISMGTKRAVRTLLFDGTPLSLEKIIWYMLALLMRFHLPASRLNVYPNLTTKQLLHFRVQRPSRVGRGRGSAADNDVFSLCHGIHTVDASLTRILPRTQHHHFTLLI